MLKFRASLFTSLFLAVLLLQACSSGNGFHLRKDLELPARYQQIQVVNIAYDSSFVKVFEEVLDESGGKLVQKVIPPITTKISINNFREGKRIIAYTNQRKAREYLLSLKFDYSIGVAKKSNARANNYRINLDRVFIYDADFALGKEEEENKIRKDLYEEAARLILLKLQYAKR